MRRNLFLTAVLLLLAMPAAALQLIYPADKTYVVRSDFLIIKGGGTPPVEGVAIEINGARSDVIDISAADYRAAFGDMLILQPEFDPGKNKVTVEGYVGGKKVATVQGEIYYLPSPDALPPAGVKPYVMHLPEKEALCAPCHNMSPGKAELAASTAETNPCASCHKRLFDKTYVHGPAGVYRCTYCHEPTSRPSKYRPRGKDAELCNECHKEKADAFARNKFVHGPVGAGLCEVCHDAHASDQPAQLKVPVNELCLGCHENVAKGSHVVRAPRGGGHPVSGRPDPSNPGRELSCASCHDPHGGAASALFQRGITSRMALCQLCHQK